LEISHPFIYHVLYSAEKSLATCKTVVYVSARNETILTPEKEMRAVFTVGILVYSLLIFVSWM
jgi:hypothetical protein